MHSTVTVTFSLSPMRLIYPFGEDLEAAIKVKLLATTRGYDQAIKSQLYSQPQTMPSAHRLENLDHLDRGELRTLNARCSEFAIPLQKSREFPFLTLDVDQLCLAHRR